MKTWVIYVHEDGRYTGLHVRCPHSAVSYGVHVLHTSLFWNWATRCACVIHILNCLICTMDLQTGIPGQFSFLSYGLGMSP